MITIETFLEVTEIRGKNFRSTGQTVKELKIYIIDDLVKSNLRYTFN